MLSSPALPRTIGFGCTHQVYSWNWVFWWWRHPLAILSEKTVHIQDSDILRSLSFLICFVQLCFSVPLRLKTTIKECVYVQPKLVWISSALFTIQFLTIYKCPTYNVYTKFSRFTKTSFHMKGDYEVGERCTSYLMNIFIACNCNGSCKMNNKSFAK